MYVDGIEFRFERGLWLSFVPSRFGLLELLLEGNESAPEQAKLDAFLRFRTALDNNIADLKCDIPWGFFWHPMRIAINNENRVGVQFRNWITGNQGKLILERASQPKLRAVGGVAAYTVDGKVVYNLLTPQMQQFMGRCIGAIKKAGISARGTGQFSVLIGDLQTELPLDDFYQPNDDPSVLDRVVAKAKDIVSRS